MGAASLVSLAPCITSVQPLCTVALSSIVSRGPNTKRQTSENPSSSYQRARPEVKREGRREQSAAGSAEAHQNLSHNQNYRHPKAQLPFILLRTSQKGNFTPPLEKTDSKML